MAFTMIQRTISALVGVGSLLALPLMATAATVTYNLRAAATSITLPDATVVPVWGYALVAKDGTPGPNIPMVPGPQLEAAAGDTLVINLTVDPSITVPTSVLIPGQVYTPGPVKNNADGKGSVPRMRSFVPEATTAAPQTYTFTNLKAGTYLYESGSMPAVQLPMGLYGALVVNTSVAGQAYTPTATNPDTTYDGQAVMLLSELDPALNSAVSSSPASYSTIEYAPKYFLINGKAYPQTSDLNAPLGMTTLIRLLNAGAQNYVLSFPGNTATIIAQDGKLSPYAKQEHSVSVTAGKTLDAVVTPAEVSFRAVFERRLALTNSQSFAGGALKPGGMLTFIAAYPDGQNCSPLKGDVTGDGQITLADVLNALRSTVLGTGASYPLADVFPLVNGLPCGDANTSTSTPANITLSDVLLIMRKAVGQNPY